MALSCTLSLFCTVEIFILKFFFEIFILFYFLLFIILLHLIALQELMYFRFFIDGFLAVGCNLILVAGV